MKVNEKGYICYSFRIKNIDENRDIINTLEELVKCRQLAKFIREKIKEKEGN